MSQLHINTISQICADHGISEAVVSPGSRSAPLTLAFARNPAINCRVIPDERSAGFIALGLAQHTKRAVVLICTSGTAGLNYGPAIAEAFYQKIPLLILTADRPPELIDQMDGQTIHQEGMFDNHVKGSFTAPADLSEGEYVTELYEIFHQALRLTLDGNHGPVHINMPFREPFYPEFTEFEVDSDCPPSVKPVNNAVPDPAEDVKAALSYGRILLLCGQRRPGSKFIKIVDELIEKHSIPVVGDILSNLHKCPKVIHNPDSVLLGKQDGLMQSLKPDLLITFGDSTISKNLKLFLRKNPPAEHWHIQLHGEAPDTFQCLTRHLRYRTSEFLVQLRDSTSVSGFKGAKRENYFNIWKVEGNKSLRKTSEYLNSSPFGELKATSKILKAIPDRGIVHLGNSMPVRLANFTGTEKTVTIRSNRGTSGIDGTNATAVGNALVSGDIVTLITGDIAFFYDRNAFWHKYDLRKLRLIILNNQGGGIFGMIEGPRKQPELEEYFLTPHGLNAKNTALDYGMEYLCVEDENSLTGALTTFWDDSEKAKILEIKTAQHVNQTVLDELKKVLSTES